MNKMERTIVLDGRMKFLLGFIMGLVAGMLLTTTMQMAWGVI